MSQSRQSYFERYNRLRAEKKRLAKAGTTGSPYPSLAWCLSLTDDALLAAYATLKVEPRPLKVFDDSPLSIPESLDAPKPWTTEMQAADVAAQVANSDLCLRMTLFSIGVEAYVSTLAESQVLAKLKDRKSVV